MTETPATLIVPQSETATLRLFRIDPSDPKARLLAEAPTSATIAASLGLSSIPPSSAEVVRLADISVLGLRNYLTQGYDVLPDSFATDTDIDSLSGHVLIVQSSVAAGGAVTLRPGPSLQLVGIFAQGRAAPTPLNVPEPEQDMSPGQAPAPMAPQRSGGIAVLAVLLFVVAVIGFALSGYAPWSR
jgi:hypothetical protein